MALVACKECKGQVSSTAEKCPHCGARVPKLGRGVFGLVVIVVLGFAWILSDYETPKPTTLSNSAVAKSSTASTASATPQPDWIRQAKVEREQRFAEFARDRVKIIAEMKRLTGAKKYGEAAALGDKYADVEDAEFNALHKTANDKIGEKIAAQMKAAAKKEGVRIGMTQEQVRGSSWGNPSHVNRTIFSNHVKEQWVYDRYHNGYLYFTDGILTAISN